MKALATPILSLSLIVVGCPGDPAFRESDGGATDAPEIPTTPDAATDVASEAESGRVPCESDCLVPVTSEASFAMAAVVDREGVAEVVTFREPSPGQYHLVLRQFDGSGAWPYETIDALVREPAALTIAEDEVFGGLHILVRSGSGLVVQTSWFRRLPGQAWEMTDFVDRDCQRSRLRARLGLFAGCTAGDGSDLTFFRLFGTTSETLVWQNVAEPVQVGQLSPRLHVPVVWPYDWDIDVLARPHVAYQCCVDIDNPLTYASWNGTRWVDEAFGPIAEGPGIDRRNLGLALDGDGHPHLVHQSFEGSPASARLIHRTFNDTWLVETLDAVATEGVEIGQALAVERDRAGRIHIAYSFDHHLVYRIWGAAPGPGGWSDKIESDKTLGDESLVLITFHETPSGERPDVVFTDSDGAVWWWAPGF